MIYLFYLEADYLMGGVARDDDNRKRTMERFIEHHPHGKHGEDFPSLFEGKFSNEWGEQRG